MQRLHFFPKRKQTQKNIICYKSEHVVLFLSYFCFPPNLDNSFISLSSDIIHQDQCKNYILHRIYT